MKIVGPEGDLIEHPGRNHHIGAECDQAGAPQHLRLERRDLGRGRDRANPQSRIVAPQNGSQNRLLHRAGEQDDGIEHGNAQPSVPVLISVRETLTIG